LSPQTYTLLGLTALVAALVSVVVFAVLRFATAAREARKWARSGQGAGDAVMTAALQEAIGRLREQERAMQARAEASEQLSDEIVASITAGLMLVEDNGAVRILNPAGRRLLGLGNGGARDGSYRELLTHVPALADLIDQALKGGHAIVRRTIGVPPATAGDLGVTHFGVTVSPIAHPARSRAAVICLFSDLTAAIAMEDQLRLKDSLARLGELSAGLAHEFRNSLATIHGYARMLDPERLEAAQGACVVGIRDETDALGALVTKFLEFARPAALTLAPTDVGPLLTAVVGEARTTATRLGGTASVSGDFGVVEGDAVLLRQAFDNLCRNAIEACQIAGVAPRVSVDGRVDSATGQLFISVGDNGPGIGPADLPKVFQPFFTTKSDGTGLGLALVQKVIVSHNGRVSVHNRPAGGAVFTVALPLHRPTLTDLSAR
jgi:signal transduction histidine kinase